MRTVHIVLCAADAQQARASSHPIKSGRLEFSEADARRAIGLGRICVTRARKLAEGGGGGGGGHSITFACGRTRINSHGQVAERPTEIQIVFCGGGWANCLPKCMSYVYRRHISQIYACTRRQAGPGWGILMILHYNRCAKSNDVARVCR